MTLIICMILIFNILLENKLKRTSYPHVYELIYNKWKDKANYLRSADNFMLLRLPLILLILKLIYLLSNLRVILFNVLISFNISLNY